LKKFTYISILFALLLSSGVSSYAQVKTTVLTRSIEKQFTMSKYPALYINTERGIIFVKGWDSNEVKVVLKLTARNTDPDMARKELDYMKYSITETHNTVYVSNRMLLSQPNQEISSVILAEYVIYVSHEIEIHVDNRFGKLEIENVNGLLLGELHYCDLSLNQKSGPIAMFIAIGDFNCTKSKLTGNVTTRHSNISITETSGKLHMETEYGNLRIAYGNELFRFSMLSNATEINIENKLCIPLLMNLVGAYCPLKISGNCYTPEKTYLKSDYQQDSDQSAWKMIYLPPEKTNRLNINAKFGTLNLF
jgi:hypothetical protein